MAEQIFEQFKHPLRPKWYFRTSTLIAGFLTIGPLILPLVWVNPHYSWRKKIVLSAIMLLISLLLIQALAGAIKSITEYYQLTGV